MEEEVWASLNTLQEEMSTSRVCLEWRNTKYRNKKKRRNKKTQELNFIGVVFGTQELKYLRNLRELEINLSA